MKWQEFENAIVTLLTIASVAFLMYILGAFLLWIIPWV